MFSGCLHGLRTTQSITEPAFWGRGCFPEVPIWMFGRWTVHYELGHTGEVDIRLAAPLFIHGAR